jgi:putative oxidoreductase
MSRPSLVSRWSTWGPQMQSVLRIVAAFIFMLSGTMKLFAFPTGVPPDGGTVKLVSQMGLGGFLEVFGGLLLLVGLLTRPVAFVLAGEMAVAYFQFHFAQSFWPVVNNGVAAALYCFVWLFFSAAGAGPWSVDAWLKSRKEKRSRVPRQERRPIEVGPGHGGRLPA